ncbi:MAG: ribonuclease H-like domain-containing protein [Nitrospira sp.]|nr:ribonuclease H-like domain-containing protein [Nitrospira sp.]
MGSLTLLNSPRGRKAIAGYLKAAGGNATEAARQFGVPARTMQRWAKILGEETPALDESSEVPVRILFLDIETAPNVAHVWGLWNQHVHVNQLMASGYVMCWAAKWLGKNDVQFRSVHKDGVDTMLGEIHDLLSTADCVVHFNGTKFDIPTLNKEFLLHGLMPPPPAMQLDLLKVVRKQFRFPSNKMDYVAKALGFEGKLLHRGHDLWVECMAGNAAAWEEMKAYNIQDVRTLEQIYHKVLPWIIVHPPMGLYLGRPDGCPNCGSTNLNARGYAYTKVSKYQRYRCNDCGTWTRSTRRTDASTMRATV